MYSTGVCPYCVQAETIARVEGRGRDHEDPRRPRARQARGDDERTGRRTVPQIYIGDHHVGGYDDLAALDRAGELAPLLAG